MTRFGTIPREPHRQNALDLCAPKFEAAVLAWRHDMQDAGFDPIIFESLRTDEREVWLNGFGRLYDDGRGIVTKASTALYSWHGFGLAVDVISIAHEWDAPEAFWKAKAAFATVHGLTDGSTWKVRDLPRLQWGKPMRDSPSDFARQLYADGGMQAVWREVGAD
jgi:peptidoglycan LD-endopeptidase CwlK